jgi:hypothetical protein
MGWFSKKEETEESKLPELPDLPQSDSMLPPPPETTSPEVNTLPALPGPESEQKETGDVIKSAIDAPKAGMQKTSYDAMPMPEEKPLKIKDSGPRTVEMSPPRMASSSIKETQPIYIRLDKFKTTAEAFEEIRTKVMEIERLFMKTREIRAKEEEELAEWEKEIQMIKSRVEAIDKNIFNKLD